jgi:hypothetical protein
MIVIVNCPTCSGFLPSMRNFDGLCPTCHGTTEVRVDTSLMEPSDRELFLEMIEKMKATPVAEHEHDA